MPAEVIRPGAWVQCEFCGATWQAGVARHPRPLVHQRCRRKPVLANSEGFAPEGGVDAGFVEIARCPEHGLHGDRHYCYVCGGPVERVRMRPVEGGMDA